MRREKKLPKVSLILLCVIILACGLADFLAPYSPDQMDPAAAASAPNGDHILGTDYLGRDLFSMLIYGGRASLIVGFLGALISTTIAVVLGAISGLAGQRIDDLIMRFSELLMSIPSVLLIIFLQALWGEADSFSLSVIIGSTGWMNMAKLVRSEVRQIGKSDYILAARTMEAGFWYILRRHLLPAFVPPLMFMVVNSIGQAMVTESTLSFLGLGLPLTEVSWGSLLSMSEEVLMTDSWWLIVIPGAVLVVTLVCVTEIGEYVRKSGSRLYSNL